MRPKFEAGEVVLLRSREYPELNCETTVIEVVKPNVRIPSDNDSSIHYRGQDTYTYRLPISVMHEGALTSYWAESALRKKHLPGELSFTDLMASLSSPKLITHQA